MIRRAEPADRDALYEVCLRTGDSGDDATGLYDDPELLGHVYCGPYLALEPDLALVADDDDGRPAGYVLGCADTAAFEAACERDWWPALRQRYPDLGAPGPKHAADATPTDRLIRYLHHPPVASAALLADYPAHLHIDLLPVLQGRGVGRVLIDAFLDRLRSRGVVGVHLGVSPTNHRAIGFYEHVGFHRVTGSDDPPSIVFGINLRGDR